MKHETHRADERFDPYANEESYFAKQEHELIEQRKIEHQKTEAAQRQALTEMCPKCSGKLGKFLVKGLEVERCQNCEGIWLNRGELNEILRRQAAGPLGIFLERCFARAKS